jgi:D-inositol-3-phosphate glycosyltransferase
LTPYLEEFIKRERIEIIHTNAYIPTPAASVAGKRAGVPVVTSVHLRLGKVWWRVANPFTALWNVLFEDLIIRCFHHDLVHVTAEPTRKALARITRAPVKDIPNYVDTRPFQQYAKELRNGGRGPQKVLVSLNSLLPVKALPRAVAWLRSSDEKATLIIAGTGPDEARIRKAAGNDRRIKLVGLVVGQQKYRLLAQSDAFVLLSLSEQFSLAAIEALALGKEVIATPVGAIPALARSGWADRIHIVKNADEFVAAIRKIRRRPTTVDRKLLSRYEKNNILGKFEHEYRQLLKRR